MNGFRYGLVGLVIITGQTQATISLSPSIVFQKNNQTQSLLLQTSPQNLSNQYVGNSGWRNNLMLDVFVGDNVLSNNNVDVSAGVSAAYVDSLNFSGIVNQFALPSFNNFSYDYKVRSISLVASTKVLFKKSMQWQPYVSAGFGVSNNTAYDYVETPLIAGAVGMEPFTSNTKISYAYNVGAGVQLKTSERFSVGIGYEFSDLGQAWLGTSSSQTTSETPHTDHAYLNKLRVNLNWDK